MRYRRAQLLINKRFQLKFAFFVSSWVFVLSLVYPYIIYQIFEYCLKFLPADSAEKANLIRDVQNQVIMLLAILQLLVLAITFFISIFLSHRIAGPLYKLRNAMDEVTKGNFDLRITFRKNDHFMELQDTFNEMVQHLAVRKWR